jgi:hypothetical protein
VSSAERWYQTCFAVRQMQHIMRMMLQCCIVCCCCCCHRVWGVAESSAERWYQAGCRTLDDVRTKITHLSAMQQVCA